MMYIYFRIKRMTALIVAIVLITAGVFGMLVPLVPEIAVLLLGVWLLGMVGVNPFGRWRLHPIRRGNHNISNLYDAGIPGLRSQAARTGNTEADSDDRESAVYIHQVL